jgi:predicted ribosomally synthesized peptide with nif11-like leader
MVWEDSIMPINKNELTKEMLAKAMQCESPEELRAYAKSEGFDITEEEAKAYFSELEDFELDSETLENVAGGDFFSYVRGAQQTTANIITKIVKS